MWKDEDYLNTLLVDAYFFLKGEENLRFQANPGGTHYQTLSSLFWYSHFKASHDLILFDVPFHRFEHVISFTKWKSRSLFPFSAGSKTLKI